MLGPVSCNEEAGWTEARCEPALFAKRILRVAADLPPGLGADAARAVADRLASRHPILRTAYTAVGGEPRRLVLEAWPHEVGEGPVGLAPPPGPELGPGDLVRAWHSAGSVPRMGFDLSEMVSDPWSCARLQGEMASLLAALAAGGQPELPPLAATYAEFAAEQRDFVGSEGGAELLTWWVSELRGADPATYVPADGPDPSGDLAGERIRVLDRELLACLRALTARHRLTPFMAAISLVAMVLASVSGERELCLATATASRPARWADVQGSFANLLVLRVELPDRPGFAEVAVAVRRAVLRGLAHRDLPHQVVSRALGGGWRQPPVRIGYLANRGHQFTSLDGRDWGEEWTEQTDFSSTPVDLGFAEDGRGRLALWLNYDARLFTHARMKGLMEATWTALRLAGADPGLDCARLAEALEPAAAPALGSRA
jgi:hypothetical protein